VKRISLWHGSPVTFMAFLFTGIIALIISGLIFIANVQAQTSSSEEKETVLDRKAHIEKEWVLQIPEVPRLCDVLPLKKHKIHVGDCELYCDEEGEGMPIVVLHGGPGATHHYFHPWFSRAKSFARIIYYDQRGCGLSDYKAGAGYSVSQAVDDLDKLRQALKIDQWVVVGHSYGGYLGQQYAVKYPEHLAGLVLVGASEAMPMKLGTRQYDFMTPEEGKKISEAFQAKDLTPVQRLFNAHLNGDWKRQNFYRPSRERLAQMARYEWVQDPAFRGQIGGTIIKNLEGYFDTYPVPTLIMEGKWDLTWSGDKPQKMQEALPRAQLIVFERSSHSPFEDEPDRFFAELEKFVGRLRKPSADELASWRKDLERISLLPANVIRKIWFSDNYGAGAEASKKIVKEYKKEWLAQLNSERHSDEINRLGSALYDEKRYEEALEAFKKSDSLVLWQGIMLDLLGRRDEAIKCYQKELENKYFFGWQFDQYGIVINEDYIKQRLETPFTRKENRSDEMIKEKERYFQLPPYISVKKALASGSPWGKEASRKIAEEYKKEWLTQVDFSDWTTSLRLGFALYDEMKYGDALEVFIKGNNLVWQGHMLDLLGRRNEAILCYQKALESLFPAIHDQYGIKISQEYVKHWLEKPFIRIENKEK
jgi:proline iminopeptidase